MLFGLPWLLTGSILAHETMHAWLRLSGISHLPADVEEGLAQLMALLWLEHQAPDPVCCTRHWANWATLALSHNRPVVVAGTAMLNTSSSVTTCPLCSCSPSCQMAQEVAASCCPAGNLDAALARGSQRLPISEAKYVLACLAWWSLIASVHAGLQGSYEERLASYLAQQVWSVCDVLCPEVAVSDEKLGSIQG